ncbi:hypothetical protein ACFFRR_002339 [Megaselia abdita]
MVSSSENSSDNDADSAEPQTFEEAISSTMVGRFHYFHLFIAGMCAMSMMVEVSCLSLVMSAAKCDLNFTVYQQGLLGSSGFIGVAIGCQVLGFLADSLGRVKTLRIMLGISICSSLISAFSVNFQMLMVFRVFTGFFISGCQSCVFSYVAEFHGSKSRVKYITMTAVFLPIGGVYFPGIAIGVLPLSLESFSPWRLYLILNILPSIIACGGLFLLPESPKYLLSQGKPDECLKVLRQIFSVNTGKSKNLYPCSKLETLEFQRSQIGLKLIKDKFKVLFSKNIYLQTLNLCFVAFGITFVGTGTYMWLPVIISFLLSNSETSSTVCEAITSSQAGNSTISSCEGPVNTLQYEILLYIGVFFVCSYFFISQIITLVGKKRLFVCWLGVNAVSSIVIYWIHNIYASMVALTIVVAIGNTNSILNAIAADYFPTDVNAMALSIILMSCKVGAVVGTNVFGSILLQYCNQFFFVIGGFIVLLLGLVFLLPGNKR